jgi:methanogenic corrinoid protein MtbC1
MRDLVDSGWSPKEAARRVLEAPAAAQPTDAAPAPLDELARCAELFDLERVEQVLDEAFARSDLGAVVDDWLMPSLVRLGEAWQRGQVSIAGEHFISAAVHRRLAYAFQQLPAAGPEAPRVAVGLARGSRHELGVLAFAAVLRSQGVGVTYLGSDLPLEAWIETVRTLGPDAVVIGVPTIEDLPAVREVVAALAPRGLVLVGGAHQDRVEGAEALGHVAGRAARDLAARLRG